MLSTGTYVSSGPIEVSQAMQDGEKFIKWDDVSKNKFNHNNENNLPAYPLNKFIIKNIITLQRRFYDLFL
ncbi:5-bisphosphate phosphodiesterase classes I and II, 1-phosphatidylinositol 4 [Lucilia cuprina]|nr:5-bisphosphate phosphodiesterase classes I and II, 1-phosphatidylinositol 4 [Lucilia cuprina]